MKKDFETLYQEMINEESVKQQWNDLQKEKKKANRIFIYTAIILDFMVIKIISVQISLIIALILVWDFLLYIIIRLHFSKNRKKYNNTFKKIIIQKLINNFYSEVNYAPTVGMPQYTYNEGKYKEFYNIYHSEDYFKGTIEQKNRIQLAEIKTENRQQYVDSNGKIQTTTTTIFNGLFAKININKSIQTELKIRTNWIGLNKKKNKLEMDSQEFEKHFDVYTNNQIIGMQLLTADVMEMLVDFKNTMKIKYDISIYYNAIYLRFMTGPMFEAKISNKQIIDRKSVEKYYKVLEFTFNLSNKLMKIIEQTQL